MLHHWLFVIRLLVYSYLPVLVLEGDKNLLRQNFFVVLPSIVSLQTPTILWAFNPWLGPQNQTNSINYTYTNSSLKAGYWGSGRTPACDTQMVTFSALGHTLASISFSIWLLQKQSKGSIFCTAWVNSGVSADTFGVPELTKSASMYSSTLASMLNLTHTSGNLLIGNWGSMVKTVGFYLFVIHPLPSEP